MHTRTRAHAHTHTHTPTPSGSICACTPSLGRRDKGAEGGSLIIVYKEQRGQSDSGRCTGSTGWGVGGGLCKWWSVHKWGRMVRWDMHPWWQWCYTLKNIILNSTLKIQMKAPFLPLSKFKYARFHGHRQKPLNSIGYVGSMPKSCIRWRKDTRLSFCMGDLFWTNFSFWIT